jgi:hypothetical protein
MYQKKSAPAEEHHPTSPLKIKTPKGRFKATKDKPDHPPSNLTLLMPRQRQIKFFIEKIHLLFPTPILLPIKYPKPTGK